MSTIAIIIAAISAATTVIQIIQERRRRKKLEAEIRLVSERQEILAGRQDSLSFALSKPINPDPSVSPPFRSGDQPTPPHNH